MLFISRKIYSGDHGTFKGNAINVMAERDKWKIVQNRDICNQLAYEPQTYFRSSLLFLEIHYNIFNTAVFLVLFSTEPSQCHLIFIIKFLFQDVSFLWHEVFFRHDFLFSVPFFFSARPGQVTADQYYCSGMEHMVIVIHQTRWCSIAWQTSRGFQRFLRLPSPCCFSILFSCRRALSKSQNWPAEPWPDRSF